MNEFINILLRRQQFNKNAAASMHASEHGLW